MADINSPTQSTIVTLSIRSIIRFFIQGKKLLYNELRDESFGGVGTLAFSDEEITSVAAVSYGKADNRQWTLVYTTPTKAVHVKTRGTEVLADIGKGPFTKVQLVGAGQDGASIFAYFNKDGSNEEVVYKLTDDPEKTAEILGDMELPGNVSISMGGYNRGIQYLQKDENSGNLRGCYTSMAGPLELSSKSSDWGNLEGYEDFKVHLASTPLYIGYPRILLYNEKKIVEKTTNEEFKVVVEFEEEIPGIALDSSLINHPGKDNKLYSLFLAYGNKTTKKVLRWEYATQWIPQPALEVEPRNK